ncbi:hypothetical protein Tco_1298548 [Tanacetum coccineum]
MVYAGDDAQPLFTSHAWRRLFEVKGPLVREFILEFLSTCRMSDTETGLVVADTQCFQLGGARRRMTWREQRGTSSIRHYPVGAKQMLIPRTSVRGSKSTPQDFLKLVDSLDLNGENRERTRMQSLFEAWTRFKDLLQKVPHHGIDLWLQVQIFYDHVNPVTKRTIDQSAGGKLRDLNAEEYEALLEDLALYDNESWNDPRDFVKLVKAIALPQDVPSTFDRHLIKLENQVQCLIEVHLTSTQPTQVNKITTSCEIYSGPHDTQYCMKDPEQAFVEYASSGR